MKKKVVALVAGILLMINLLPISVFATGTSNDDIVILYENDVHCEINGYSKLSALKKELQESYKYVGVVSGGDYIQGTSMGVVSRGQYIVELMNLVGYDAVTLGNHEFDYRIERLEELIDMMETKPVSCNFQKVGEDESYFKPYSIVSYGDIDIAYVGITTPTTITTAYPTQFKDENGNYIYSFNATTLYEVVQKNIDAAVAEGADYVIALSHIGYAEDEIYGNLEDIETLIENTEGFDVVLDAHSHSVIESMELTDKGGNTVLLSSTGTKFENIGKLTISGDSFETELIKVEDYQKTDPVVDAHIAEINDEYLVLGNRIIGYSEVDLITHDAEGNRLVRKAETTLGELCADACRYAVNADIGYVNGGGIRTPITKGDITYNDLLNVFPFNNTVVLAELSGQTLKDMMETAMMVWPEELGSFPHLSGLRFSVNTSISSSVVLDEYDEFVEVAGEYRVYNMEVFNRESGKYEPLDLEKKYTIAASNFFLIDHGSGMKMLENSTVLQNDGILDVQALELYINEVLGGTVGEDYAAVKTNITFTKGEIKDDGDADNGASGETDAPQTDNPQTDDKQTNDVVYTVINIVVTVAWISAFIVSKIIVSKKR